MSVCTGLAYIIYMRSQLDHDRPVISKATGLDFFNGIALAPLALMFLAAFSETVLSALMHSSGIILAAASVLALLAILEERPV